MRALRIQSACLYEQEIQQDTLSSRYLPHSQSLPLRVMHSKPVSVQDGEADAQ